MQKNPLVSVIIPTYNRGNLLHETIDSVLKQTYTNLELIVVDNNSTDNTDQIINNYNEPRIKYFKNNNYGVISVNRNYGIRRACGEYICFCDSDDLWEKEKIETQVVFMEDHQEIEFCCTNGKVIDENNIVKKDYFKKTPPNVITFRKLITHNYIATLSVMIRRKVISDIGLFDETKPLSGIEDLHFWLRIAQNSQVHFIPEFLFKYRIHGRNEMGDDSYRWARKCMILAKYMRSRGTLKSRHFVEMYGYNVFKSLFYYRLRK